jgi:hypothetical protein
LLIRRLNFLLRQAPSVDLKLVQAALEAVASELRPGAYCLITRGK